MSPSYVAIPAGTFAMTMPAYHMAEPVSVTEYEDHIERNADAPYVLLERELDGLSVRYQVKDRMRIIPPFLQSKVPQGWDLREPVFSGVFVFFKLQPQRVLLTDDPMEDAHWFQAMEFCLAHQSTLPSVAELRHARQHMRLRGPALEWTREGQLWKNPVDHRGRSRAMSFAMTDGGAVIMDTTAPLGLDRRSAGFRAAITSPFA